MRNLPDLFRDANYLVGFDRLFQDLERTFQAPAFTTTYPPYNIVKTGDNGLAIEIAVAGYSADQISVTQEGQELVVRGEKNQDTDVAYLWKGISSRKFERRFALADHVQTVDAQFKDGLLVLNLVQEIPESAKPKQIPVQV